MPRLHRSLVEGLRSFSVAAAIATVVASGLILLGWLFDYLPLTRLFIGQGAIWPTYALGSLALALALLVRHVPGPRARQVTIALSAPVLALNLLDVVATLAGPGLDLDRLLLPEEIIELAGAPLIDLPLAGAITECLLSASLLLAGCRRDRLSEGLALLALAQMYVTSLAILIRVQILYDTLIFPAGVVLGLLLVLGTLASRPEHGVMGFVTGETPGGVLLRRLLPTALLLPSALAWLWDLGRRTGLLEVTQGMFLVSLATTVIILGFVWWNVATVNRAEAVSRRAVEEVARRTAELQKARELNQLKDHFMSTMSHEMKTPLSLILGNTELLEDLCPYPELIAGIKDGSRRLTEHIDSILDYSALISGTLVLYRTELDPADLAQQAAAIMEEAAARKQIALEVSVEADLPTVSGDARRLVQALSELLENAVKVTPAGARIGVHVEQAGSEVRFEVWDPGPGIPEHAFGRIWEAFSQLEMGDSARLGGLGLGLTIVKMLVELHGGRVELSSTVGQGSRFTIVLPALLLAGEERA